MKSLLLVLVIFSNTSIASEAIGFYSKGKLKDGVSIDEYASSHLIKLFRSRGQLYGTLETQRALAGLADHQKNLYPSIEPTQIGDIAAEKGAKIPRHKSHQNGLDSDVVFYRVNEQAQSIDYPEWAENFVKGGKLSSNFHVERNWEAFKYLVKNHNVGRIFVDGVIKRALCKYAKENGELDQERETLRRLRIENTVHKNHFHLRLKCPKENKLCLPQAEPPAGSGC